MTELVRLDKVTCAYGADPVLVNVDLRVQPGSFIGVVGPSGSGKTSLLRVVTRTLKPVAGRVRWPAGMRQVGYVPQVET
ncbi:MAG: ATP-binding cassette domain-containing protein, partial [Actinomycetota bacterium]